MKILAIESSCDESSVAILENNRLIALHTKTQTIHQQFGGVVPELAGRSHLELIDQLVLKSLEEANLSLKEIDYFAATVGPGLIGSLLVGMNYTKSLAFSVSKPFIPIHHLEAHLWSAEIESGLIPLPFIILLVSGGHTQLVFVEGLRQYTILGSTLDDALGEAYDKVGKLLGLNFPAGAEVDKLASQGNSKAFAFSEPMSDKSYNFSFSGLKTAFLYKLKEIEPDAIQSERPNLLASFQSSVLSSVIKKVNRAVQEYQPKAITVAGGVAANSMLRQMFQKISTDFNVPFFAPSIKLCADNAGMIGYLAWKTISEDQSYNSRESVHPRWPLASTIEAEFAV